MPSRPKWSTCVPAVSWHCVCSRSNSCLRSVTLHCYRPAKYLATPRQGLPAMTDEHEDRPSPDSASQAPVDTSRRRFLGGAAVLGVGATLSACGNANETPGKPVTRPLTPQELDKALHDQVKTVVV